MRKVGILIIICLLVYLSYDAIYNGNGFLKPVSYTDIQTANKELDMLITTLNQKNTTEYSASKANLASAVQTYESTRSQYEALAETQKQMAYESTDLYDLEFLWTEIGNYSRKNTVAMKMNIAKSTTSYSESEEYIICDLDFDLVGGYINVTDFIYDIEDDDRFGFEICEFSMVKADSSTASSLLPNNTPTEMVEGAVNAKFKVKGLPVNASTVSTFTSEENEENSTEGGDMFSSMPNGSSSVTPAMP